MEKKVFVYESKTYNTLKEIAEVRGVKQVARRDMERLGIKEVTEIVPETPETKAEPVNTPEPVETPEPEKKAEETPENKPEPEAKKEEEKPTPYTDATEKDDVLGREYPKGEEPKEPSPEPSPEPTKEPEPIKTPRKGNVNKDKTPKQDDSEPTAEELAKAKELQKEYGVANVDELAETLKGMEAEALVSMAKDLGLSWNENPHIGINRMRAGIEIRKAIFPGERRTRKPKSPWKNFNLEELVKIAKEHKLDYLETADDRITRMWVIKALKDANITPPEKVNKD